SGPSGSSLTAEGGMSIGDATLDTRDLVNAAAATLTGQLFAQGAPAITNSAGATFDLHSTGSNARAIVRRIDAAIPGDFYTAGPLTSEASVVNGVGLSLHNTGTVALHTGELDFLSTDAAGPTSSGAITGDPGTLLVFGAGSAVTGDFAPGSSIAAD